MNEFIFVKIFNCEVNVGRIKFDLFFTEPLLSYKMLV
jgi:hypothetical protein